MTSSPDAVDTAPPSPLPAPRKGLALTALILGIAAFVTGWIPGLGIVLGLVAIVFGIIALVRKQSKALSITGTALGAVGLIASAVMTAVVLALVSNPAFMQEFAGTTPPAVEETAPDATEDAGDAVAGEGTPAREEFSALDDATLAGILADVPAATGSRVVVYGEVLFVEGPEYQCSALVYVDDAQQTTWEGYAVPIWATPETVDDGCSAFAGLGEGSHVALWGTVLGNVPTNAEDGTIEDVMELEIAHLDQLAPLA